MLKIKTYETEMQRDVEDFFKKCFSDLGWDYEPHGEHSDILNINDVYMRTGRMWCLYNNEQLIGTIALRAIDAENKNAEMKRLYVLKEFQGNGYGGMLFEMALSYVKENNFSRVYADTAKDRNASRHMLDKYGFIKTAKYPGSSQYTEVFYELEIL